jgi:hypothetical protein
MKRFQAYLDIGRGMSNLDIGRGMSNPGGIGEGYEGVVVRVDISIPLACPYPCARSASIWEATGFTVDQNILILQVNGETHGFICLSPSRVRGYWFLFSGFWLISLQLHATYCLWLFMWQIKLVATSHNPAEAGPN